MASHNGSYFSAAGRINQPGTALGKSFSTTHTTVGSPNESFVHNFCAAAGQVHFGSSVFYEIHPHRVGRYGISVTGLGGFQPVVVLYEYVPLAFPQYNYSTNAPCTGSTPPTNTARLPQPGHFLTVAAGRHYKIQIGGPKSPNVVGGTPSAGSYRLAFSYDPDSDGDGLFDGADRCPGARGAASLGGCPDTDADGVADVDDKCPREDNRDRPDRRRRGCLKVLQLDDDVVTKLRFNGLAGVGVRVTSFLVVGVPPGAHVTVRCLGPRGSGCGRRGQRASSVRVRAHVSRRLRFRYLRGKRLRAGSRIIVRVTAPKSVGYFGRYRILNRSPGFKLKEGCLTLRKRQVRFGRSSCR